MNLEQEQIHNAGTTRLDLIKQYNALFIASRETFAKTCADLGVKEVAKVLLPDALTLLNEKFDQVQPERERFLSLFTTAMVQARMNQLAKATK